MQISRTYQDTLDLEPGWYAIGFNLDDGETAPHDVLAQYHGNGCWSDEDDEPINALWHPLLQHYVAMDAADSYVKQN